VSSSRNSAEISETVSSAELNTCGDDEFACKDGRCISNDNVCNGRSDCSDGSDEFDCPPIDLNRCTVNEFRCDNGECIPSYLQCNGVGECTDASDERGCRKFVLIFQL
jgi:hypothetical protein